LFNSSICNCFVIIYALEWLEVSSLQPCDSDNGCPWVQDVYRIGTLLELVREVAFTFADDGKRVRVRHVITLYLYLF